MIMISRIHIWFCSAKRYFKNNYSSEIIFSYQWILMSLTTPVSKGRQRAVFGSGLQVFKGIWGSLAPVWAARQKAHPGMINEAAKQKLVLCISLGIGMGCENLSTTPWREESDHEVLVSVGRTFSSSRAGVVQSSRGGDFLCCYFSKAWWVKGGAVWGENSVLCCWQRHITHSSKYQRTFLGWICCCSCQSLLNSK